MRRLGIPLALFLMSSAALSAPACSSVDDCEKTLSCPIDRNRDDAGADAARDAVGAGGRLDGALDAPGGD